MTFRFTKMHGTGNDYVYVNGFEQEIENPGELSIRISDRHFGIGSDGLILIVPSKVADCRMRMYNADGSATGSAVWQNMRMSMELFTQTGSQWRPRAVSRHWILR